MTEQLVNGRLQGININPFVLSGDLYPLIDNGHGSFIEDRTAIPDIKNYTNPVRIFLTQKRVKKTVNGEDIYTLKNVYSMLSDDSTLVDVRLEFEYQGLKFKVEKREPRMKHEIIIGYEYELREITEVNIS